MGASEHQPGNPRGNCGMLFFFFFLLFIDIIERLSDAGSISTLGPNSSGGPQEGEIGHQGGTF